MGRARLEAAGINIPEHLQPENDIQAAHDHGVELFCYEEAFELTGVPPKRIDHSQRRAKTKQPKQSDLIKDIPRTFRQTIDRSVSLGAKVLQAAASVNSGSAQLPGGIPRGGGFAGFTPKFGLP